MDMGVQTIAGLPGQRLQIHKECVGAREGKVGKGGKSRTLTIPHWPPAHNNRTVRRLRCRKPLRHGLAELGFSFAVEVIRLGHDARLQGVRVVGNASRSGTIPSNGVPPCSSSS